MRADLPVVFITDELMQRTGALLSSFAEKRESEGVVYWFGLELGGQTVVTTLVVPNADTAYGNVRTSAATNAEALGAIVGTPLVLIGQAHSHPFELVGHSPIDDRDTFAQFQGALSVVVPFFGRRGMSLPECGVHRHMDGRYLRIRSSRVPQHLLVLPGIRDFRKNPPRKAT